LKEHDLGPGLRGESDLEAGSVKGWKWLQQAWVVLLLRAFTNGTRARRRLRRLRRPKKKLGIRSAVLHANDQDLQADLLGVRSTKRTEL
jgi:hypothetical protein